MTNRLLLRRTNDPRTDERQEFKKKDKTYTKTMVNAVNWRTGLVGAHRPRPLPPKSITDENFTKENIIFTTNEFNFQNINLIKKKDLKY